MSLHDSLHSPHNRCADLQDAGSDGTRAKRKQFGVFLCLPTAAVLLLIWNGDFGMSPIYGQHRARYCSPINLHMWGAGN
jgi:hypothetical protein